MELLFKDPRKMNRKELLQNIEKYGQDTSNMKEESKTVLVGILYDLLIEYGSKHPLNPDELSNEQPEKWYILAEQLHKQVCHMIQKGEERVKLIEQANLIVKNKTIDELIDIVLNTSSVFSTDDLKLDCVCRWVSTLMLETHYELKASRSVGCSIKACASVTITGNYMGFTKPPKRLSAIRSGYLAVK